MICRKCNNEIKCDDLLRIPDAKIDKNGEYKELPKSYVCPACGYKHLYSEGAEWV